MGIDRRLWVRLTRVVSFSSGHRYWFSDRTEEANRALFGRWASPFNHGHNYVLEVTVEGEIDPVTGMVVNIKAIDDVLQARIVAQFDQKSINDEIPAFRNRAPTLENLLATMSCELSGDVLPREARLLHLRLYETPLFWGDFDCETSAMKLTRSYEFSAAHRLHVPELSDAENVAMFGKCNNPSGHGHNYVLEVTVWGEPDAVTGMLCDLGALDRAVEDLVVDRYDHKHLNLDVPEFQHRTPTSEVIASEIFRRLEGRLPAKLASVRLHETARNIFEVCAG